MNTSERADQLAKIAEQHLKGKDLVALAALASTPPPAQPTEANDNALPCADDECLLEHWLDTPHDYGADGKGATGHRLAPSPVQGADDRLVQAEAVAEHRRQIDILHRATFGSELTTGDIWAAKESFRDAVDALEATYQQSPQAALNEARAGALEDAADEWDSKPGITSEARYFREGLAAQLRARAAELRAAPQTGDVE